VPLLGVNHFASRRHRRYSAVKLNVYRNICKLRECALRFHDLVETRAEPHGVLHYRDTLFELCPTVVNAVASDHVTAAFHACLSVARALPKLPVNTEKREPSTVQPGFLAAFQIYCSYWHFRMLLSESVADVIVKFRWHFKKIVQQNISGAYAGIDGRGVSTLLFLPSA